MLVSQKRPRVLRWYHAGPLLYGDWGTSRLYVLGLAFFYTAHAAPFYLLAISVLMGVVAWAYTVICRTFPEGGGVYSAARALSPTLSVVGATLLLCGYVITAAISIVEAFHYFGVPADHDGTSGLIFVLSLLAIGGLGAVNWLGARNAGRFALVIAFLAMVISLVIAALCLPYLPAGLRNTTTNAGVGGPWNRWNAFVGIVLALAGVEAVANMTGLMRSPVHRTARRTIWPVLAEVVVLNLVFGVALTGLPALLAVHAPPAQQLAGGEGIDEATRAIRDTAMSVLAHETGRNALGATAGWYFGKAAAWVFGLLLISAANTAIMAMVSVLYSMGLDHELPRPLTKLNYPGVPYVGVVVACLAPLAVLAVEQDVEALAKLYAVGVCGAITVNVLSCALNSALPIGRWQRGVLLALGAFLGGVALTIVATEPQAALFAGGLVGLVLATRQGVAWRRARLPAPIPVPARGWLEEVRAQPVELDPSRPKIMLAARGRYQAEFAVDLARRRGAILFAIYVRTLRVMDVVPGAVPRVEDDPEAQESLGTVAVLARRYGVPFVPIYVTSPEIAEEILDYTVTFGCDTLILGKTRRRWFARAVEGDVVKRIAANLPSEVALITRDATPHPMPPPPETGGPPAEGAGGPRAADGARNGLAGTEGMDRSARPASAELQGLDQPPPT
ncbi:MAG TPA: amino acid permease [Phycisphaerales bacterium]|nr:amino acid permease [Phycisphaerales bacterium]